MIIERLLLLAERYVITIEVILILLNLFYVSEGKYIYSGTSLKYSLEVLVLEHFHNPTVLN